MTKKRISPLDAITARQWASMTNKAIGDRVGGMSGQSVGRYRKRHGHPRPDKRQAAPKSWGAAGQHRQSPLSELDNATWSTSTNWELAHLLGMRHQSIAEYRHRHDKPASPSVSGQTQRWKEKPEEDAVFDPGAPIDDWYAAYKKRKGKANRATFIRRVKEMDSFLSDSYHQGLDWPPDAWRAWLAALAGQVEMPRADVWAGHEAKRIFDAVDYMAGYS